MRTLCRYPNCQLGARWGQWCWRHGPEMEWSTASSPRFDLDDQGQPEGTGDAICTFCNGRAPFRDGRFIFHESHGLKARCPGVARSAIRDGSGKRRRAKRKLEAA